MRASFESALTPHSFVPARTSCSKIPFPVRTNTKISAVMTEPSWCKKCWSMTAKIEGLRALVSEEVYEHHNKQELLESADQGCHLCKMIFGHCGAAWRKEKDTRLCFFAKAKDRDGSKRQPESDSDTHPFERRPITSLYAVHPRHVPLAIFTREGMMYPFWRTLQEECC